MAGDDEQADPLPPLDGPNFAVAVSVGLVTLVALAGVVALIVSQRPELLRLVG